MPRDINGVYTLPAGNPVVPGTVISTNWANATLTDIAAALTASITQTAADARYLKLVGGTLTGGLTVPSLNGGQLAGMRNRIINGDFRVWQRGTYFAPASNAQFVADRWRVASTGTALTVDWGGNAQVLAAFGAAGNTSFGITQTIEANNSYDMAGKTVTLAVTVDSAGYSGTITINLYRMTTRDSTSGMVVVGGASFTGPYSARRLSTQFNIPSSGNLGLYIEIIASSGITSGALTIKEVQLEIGSVATPFECRSYGTELAMCQRYFQVGPPSFTVSGTTVSAAATISLPVTMRAVPTVTHKFTDASYVAADPLSGQWGVQLAGVAYVSKTGTVNANASAIDPNTLFIRFTGMTLSQVPNYLASGDSSFGPRLSAEI